MRPFCPELADVFVWRKAFEALERPREIEIVSGDEVGEMRAYPRVSPPFVFVRLQEIGCSIARIRMNGFSSNGPTTKKSPRNIGSRLCLKTPRCSRSSTWPNCVGGSNATTRNSRVNSAWLISRAEAGAAFIITQRCASPLMDFSSANERRFPPQPACSTKNLAFPSVEDPANPPLRPERHVGNSIATIRKRLAFALVKTLYQCPRCKEILPAKIAFQDSS